MTARIPGEFCFKVGSWLCRWKYVGRRQFQLWGRGFRDYRTDCRHGGEMICSILDVQRQMSRTIETIKSRVLTLASGGIGGGMRRHPVPVDKMSAADLRGIKGVRAWGGQYSRLFHDDITTSVRQECEDDFPVRDDGAVSYSILALSGGGADGAFGAGFIYGWTQTGRRPTFKVVTGISTGALIASFAFLGPEYNEKLKEVFTTVTTKDIFHVRSFVSWLWKESFADTGPLEKLIAKYADENALQAIARAHNRGRRLYFGTANLDAQQLVVWNMGAIAAGNHPDALRIFRKVLLASASIPIAFPPVYFDVEADGKLYDEMHVDGGIITEVFFSDYMLDLPAARRKVFGQDTPRPHVAAYLIRNGKLTPSPEPVPRSLPKITRRALLTLGKAHGWDHLHYICEIAHQNQIDFNYIGIPENCDLPGKQAFDREEMSILFNLGIDLAKSGSPWRKFPDGPHEGP